ASRARAEVDETCGTGSGAVVRGPDREGDGVGAVLVEQTARDDETGLRTGVGEIAADEPAVHEDLGPVVLAAVPVGEFEGEGRVLAAGQVEAGRGAVPAHARAGPRGLRGEGRTGPGAVRVSGQRPA